MPRVFSCYFAILLLDITPTMCKILPSMGLIIACFISIAGQAGRVHAQAGEYAGVLPELLKPEVAQRLGLTDEQTTQIRNLISQRINKAVGLAQALREAPLDQQKTMRAEFSAASEKEGYALLKPEQQAELKKVRVEWMGMLGLEEAEVAKSLNLADWQQATVQEWADKVRETRRGPESRRIRDDAERKIRGELSESQWAAWQVLAGKIPASNLGAPMPPDRNPKAAEGAVLATEPSKNSEISIDDVRVGLNFQGEPWPNVLKWLAEQADMALQTDQLPPGTFTYRDLAKAYSVGQALDIMNATLLNDGYTLIRRGRLLKCVDLEQKLSKEVIREFADLVRTPEDLLKRGDFEVIRHQFSLLRLDPETTKKEIEDMLSIQGSVVSMASAGQIQVIDTAGNIRAIADMLKRAEDPVSARGSAITSFVLKHIQAEEVLAVGRGLLGLPESANTSPDINIGTDTFGTVIYATGKPEKIQQLGDLVKLMDVAPSEEVRKAGAMEPVEVQRHRIQGSDPDLAYQVASQLLAGLPDVRLALDSTAKMLIMQGRPADHKLVEDTLKTLAGESSDFEVIQLKKLDPQLAIAAIKKFFGLTDSSSATADSGAPVIDGDLLARQVWVKGTASQVNQIRELVNKLEENAASSDLGENIVVVPISGRSAASALQQMEQLWNVTNGKRNPLRYLKPSDDSNGGNLPQRTYAPEESKKEVRPKTERGAMQPGKNGIWVRSNEPTRGLLTRTSPHPQTDVAAPRAAQSELPKTEEGPVEIQGSEKDIVIMQGPGGLLIHSDDKEALEQFDRMLRVLAEQSNLSSSEPTVVYLKHISAAGAKELLEQIMSGASSSSSGGGTLLGDLAGGVMGGGMFGALLGGGGSGGSSSSLGGGGLATSDFTITADPRLNCLVISASARDMALCEQLLEVIDQVESPIDVKTRGEIAIIPVITQDATQVVTMLKTLYAERIQGASAQGGGNRGGAPDPQQFIEALRGAAGGGNRGGNRGGGNLQESKISLTAETNTNSILVIAQPQDILEIEYLIGMIDDAGGGDKEDTVVVQRIPGGMSSKAAAAALQRTLGNKAKVNTTPADGAATQNQPASPSDNTGGQDAAARAAFFQRLQQGGGMPGGFRGGPPSGGGGFPFGGGGGFRGAPNGGSSGGSSRGGGR